MLPEAKSEDLIYVSSPDYYPPSYTSNVYVYAYPSGTLVGTFTGFDNVGGLCSDADGNVWVTNAVSYDSGGYVYEYGHGATNPKEYADRPRRTARLFRRAFYGQPCRFKLCKHRDLSERVWHTQVLQYANSSHRR